MATQTLERGIMRRREKDLDNRLVDASTLRAELEIKVLQAMISGMNRDQGLLRDVFDVCPVEAFVTPSAVPLANALDLLRKSGERTTLTVLACQMQERWSRDQERFPRPDMAIIAEFSSSAWGIYGHALFLAQKLADENRCSQLRDGLLDIAAEASKYGAEPDCIADRARKLAEDVGCGRKAADIANLMARIVARMDNPDSGRRIVTPWTNLNLLLRGGFMAGELVVLAARPGLGKTALAGCVAVEAARNGNPVLFVSCEMSDESLGSRLIAREGRVDNRFFREGAGQSDVARPTILRAAESLSELPLSIVEKSTVPLCPREIRRIARRIENIGLVVVDYLQLLHPDEKSNSREREIAEMSRSFKQLALDLGIPVLLLSQLNRQTEQADREPKVSDLRESGAIEQDADIVLLLHTRGADRSSPRPDVKCLVGKSRSTGTGAAFMRFDKAFSDFSETVPWVEREQKKTTDNGL